MEVIGSYQVRNFAHSIAQSRRRTRQAIGGRRPFWRISGESGREPGDPRSQLVTVFSSACHVLLSLQLAGRRDEDESLCEQ